MRKFLLIILIFLPSIAVADQIPPGCYVADFYRTDDCFEPGLFNWTWLNPSENTQQALGNEYGEIVSYILNSEYNWRVYAAYQYGLAKRLRRACGAKCKRIK